jgi:hypothetical protein
VSAAVWSYVLSAIGITGILLAGSKYKIGWLIGFAVQPLWIVFAITHEQHGFIAAAVVYAIVYARNWLRWRREERPRGMVVRPLRRPPVDPKGDIYDEIASGPAE